MNKTGGGAFDSSDRHIYFLASGVGRLTIGAPYHDYLLVAVNELETDASVAALQGFIDRGKKIFLDSGIFNLAMAHAKKHNVSHDIALNLPPDKIDGFEALYARYIEVVTKLQSGLWGYIELDQGGRENKLKTRAGLEAKGLRPIPVYHPLGDGWDYFDYLAQNYDRICLGNVVQAEQSERLRLVATIGERHKKYPHLWIHLLGFTPSEWLNAYPVDSGDSSSWLVSVRWAASWRSFVDGKAFGRFPMNMRYKLASPTNGPTGANRSVALAAYQYRMLMSNWKNHMTALDALGLGQERPTE